MATIRRKMGHIWLSYALQLQRSHHMDIRAKGMLGASIVFRLSWTCCGYKPRQNLTLVIKSVHHGRGEGNTRGAITVIEVVDP
jgi:hypothetical protein